MDSLILLRKILPCHLIKLTEAPSYNVDSILFAKSSSTTLSKFSNRLIMSKTALFSFTPKLPEISKANALKGDSSQRSSF